MNYWYICTCYDWYCFYCCGFMTSISLSLYRKSSPRFRIFDSILTLCRCGMAIPFYINLLLGILVLMHLNTLLGLLLLINVLGEYIANFIYSYSIYIDYKENILFFSSFYLNILKYLYNGHKLMVDLSSSKRLVSIRIRLSVYIYNLKSKNIIKYFKGKVAIGKARYLLNIVLFTWMFNSSLFRNFLFINIFITLSGYLL